MDFFSVVILILALGAFAGLITIVVLYLQPASLYQKLISVTAVCSFIGLLSYLFELLADNKEEAFLAARFGYIGKCYAMALFLIFIARYCDFKLSNAFKYFILVFSTASLVIVLSSEYHNIYYTSVEFVRGEHFSYLVLGKGIFYYVFMATTISIMLAFIFICVVSLAKRKGRERRRLLLLCLSGLIPSVSLILNISGVVKNIDLTPLGIMASCCLVTFNVLRYGLLDTIQIASENAMDFMEHGILVVSNNKNFIHANKKTMEIFPELNDPRKYRSTILELFEGVDDNNLEKKTITKNNVIYELNYSRLNENNQKNGYGSNGYMLWFYDKTKEYEYTRELERLRNQAEQANKSKSMFLAKMSHEIRTPMNGITGFASLALEKAYDAEVKEYIQNIKNSADLLLDIINDILDISKIESGKMEIIDVEYNPKKLFKEVSDLIMTQAEEKGLKYIVSIDKDIPKYLIGDSIRIREVLINVLGNAVKYTKYGRVILEVNIAEKNEDGLIFEIHVKDTGVGIKPQKLESIFNAFEQTDTHANYYVEGTGLGLSIAKQLAELMGGNISVESVYGEGSDFCIVLPQKYVAKKQDESESEKNKTEKNYKVEIEPIKALIVDDNLINLRVEKGIMERYGMQVDLCESGKKCLDMVEDKKYDVIFMDHMMPEMDGVETLKGIRDGRSINATTPVLLVTANAIVGAKQQMIEIGFDGFVSKPIDVKTLESELANILPPEKIHFKSKEEKEEKQQSNPEGSFVQRMENVGVDVNKAVSLCGDMDSYMEILEIAVGGYKDKIQKIKDDLERNDMDNLQIAVHALKSGLASIGASRLSVLAKDLEYAVKDGDYEFVREYTSEMLKKYEYLMQVIERSIDKKNDKKPVNQQINKAKDVNFPIKIDKVKSLLEELEFDVCTEILDELLKSNLDEKTRALLIELKQMVDNYDAEASKDIIERLRG